MLPEIWRLSSRTGIASMLRRKAGIWPSLAALLLLPGLFVLTAGAGNPVTVQLYSGMSSPIYVSAGTVTINFSYFLMYGGKGDPVGDNADGVQADSLLGYNNSGDLLATLPMVGDPAFEHEGSGTITWSNPVDQLNQARFHLRRDPAALGRGQRVQKTSSSNSSKFETRQRFQVRDAGRYRPAIFS
jgi:hypothetical protein